MNIEERIEDFTNRKSWAIVGYSDDGSKFGHKVFHDLKRAGYQVHPVNPKGGNVNGTKVYESVADLPDGVEVVDFVVPSDVGMDVIEQCADNGFKRIWLQPGAESKDLIRKGNELGLEVVHNRCAMVEKRSWNS